MANQTITNLLTGALLALFTQSTVAAQLNVSGTIHTEHFSWNQAKYQRLQSNNVHNLADDHPDTEHAIGSFTTVVGKYPAISRKGSRTIVLFDHLSLSEFKKVVTVKNTNSECLEITPLDVTSVLCTFSDRMD